MKLLQFTKKTLVLCLSAMLLMALQFATIFTFASKNAYAATSDFISNPNFETSTSSSTGKPSNPSYWVTAGGDEDNVSKGVINTDNETFNKNNKYGLDSNPSTPISATDKKILMIDSKDNYTRFGYKTSEAIDLKANNYYQLSLSCKTDTLTNGASIYLTGSDKELTNQYHFIDVTTNPSVNSGWTTYTYFIRTNTTEDVDLYLELWLGSKADNNITSNGTVFFDNIQISSIDQNLYFDYVNAYDFSDADDMPATYRNLDLTKSPYYTQFTNSNFESATLEGWERTAYGSEENIYSGLTIAENTSEMLAAMHLDETDAIPGNTRTHGNTQALYINHKNEDGSYTEYTSSPITIKQHSFAMISAYVKTGNIKNGGAFMKVKTVEDFDDGSDAKAPLSISTGTFTSNSTALAVYNNYSLVSIYVEGNPYRDVDVVLCLGLGSEDTKTSGYVVFDDIQVDSISYSKYKAQTTNNLALYKDSDTTKILNGAFNFSAQDDTVVYPLTPRNWTVSNEISGIINVNDAQYKANSSLYGPNAINPGPTNYPGTDTNILTTKQNVLMLRNDTVTSFVSAKSDAFTYDVVEEKEATDESEAVTANVAISVYVKVQENLSNADSGAYITLLNNDIVIAKIANIKAIDWTKYTIYLEANLSTLNLQLVLSLGEKEMPTAGYAYFDNVNYVKNISDEEIASRNKDTSVFTSLSENNFDSYIENETGVYTPTTMSASAANAATTAGVINTSTVAETVMNFDIPARDGAINSNLLMIKNNAPTAFTYTTNYSLNFSNDTNYVVTVWIYTSHLVAGEDVEKYGVNISMSNVEDKFTNVVSKEELDETVWTAYSFYISVPSADSISSTLSISLGSADHETQGFVFVDAINVSKVSNADYNAVKEDAYTIKTVAKVTETDPEGDPETEPQQNAGSGVNYWILVSSLIIAVALVVALFGIAVRKVNFRMPRFNRNKKVDYNRDLNLNHADVKKELQVARNAKLKELDKQIDSVKAEMAKLKASYEESIKGLDNEQKVEKLFTKYAKDNNKLQTQVDNFESAKKYLTDEANIKLEEQREIRKREIMLEEENRILKQNQALIEKEKQKEKEAQKAKEEEGKKKARLKSKQ